MERSTIFVEVNDDSGRAFRYVSIKDRAAAHENSQNAERSSKMDNVFRRMVDLQTKARLELDSMGTSRTMGTAKMKGTRNTAL